MGWVSENATETGSQSRVLLMSEGSIPNPPLSSGPVPTRGTPWAVGAPPRAYNLRLSKTHRRSLKMHPRLGKDPAGKQRADGKGWGTS